MAAARARRWAVTGLLFVGPSSAALVNVVRPEPSGHWSGHLASAAISGGVAAAVALGTTLVWTRLPWYVVASVAAMEIGLAAQIVGNLRVARSIWATSYEDVRAVERGDVWATHRLDDRLLHEGVHKAKSAPLDHLFDHAPM